ncbi:MAG: glycosyltransferase [Methylovulum sp.]|nr:glycosyltransferase [Methylovulum sp.]
MKKIFSAMRDLSESKPFDKKKKGIKGYVEQIHDLQIHGWAIDENNSELNLSLRIDTVSYPIEPIWLDRTDVAAQFGDGFIRSGFTIEIPEALSNIFQQAAENPKRIAVLANNVALPNRIKEANPTIGGYKKAGVALANTFANNKASIKGYVERIEHIQLHGWVFDKEKSPLKLSLNIDGVLYPVTPVWLERSDIAAQFGSSFLRSGFTITVPEDVIDIFLSACQNKTHFDVIVNGIDLPKATKKPDLKIKKSDTDLEPTPKYKAKTFSFKTLTEINAKFGADLTANDFNNLLAGQVNYPIRISLDDSLNANHYLELAKRHLLKHDVNAVRTLLKICLTFKKRAEFLELLGNTYLEQKDYETAASHYEAALSSEGQPSKWLFSNLTDCKKQTSYPKAAVEALLAGIETNPEFGLLYNRLDDLIHDYWLKQQGTLEVLTIINDRAGLIAKMAEVSRFIYDAYLCAYGANSNPDKIGSCNLNRILIVGDMHIPQCVRYRIDQKIEQLELADKEVTAISWTDLAKEQEALVFHDVVIFYRVPAEPAVLKAMAQVNATGKLSLYEIDDLLFDPAYPPAIETYGGYLDLNLYNQILKGMASFNAAARYCRFGIASTQSLADKLQAMVFGDHCFVHRNGLDSLNAFKQKPLDTNKASVDIFYGSGTMAHNSDFIDLALPALTRILEEYPQANLMIAGYLKLPSAFLKHYEGRIKQMPPVKSIKAYWSLLDRADINLAVLHDDEVNGCKSELKWFEAACLGIPSVMSSTANYRDVIKQGEDGLMANTAEDWYQHLKMLVDDPAQRQAMAEKAQARTQSEYSIEALSVNICTLLAQAVDAAQPANQAGRKKIALVNVYFPPQSIGGATRVIADNFELLQQAYQDQFELSVFTTDADHKPPYQMSVYNEQQARVYRATIVWRERMDWHPDDEKMGELFSEYLEAEQPELIHFHCIQRLTGSVIEAAIKAKIPYIVTVHDAWWISDYQFLVDADNRVYPEGHPDPYEPYTPPSNITLSDSIERILYLKGLLHSAYKVLTVSNSFADIYRKNGITQIEVNKNGISESIAWQPKDTNYTDKVVCGHVGGMAEHKGYFLLKKAVTQLQPENLEMLIIDHSQDEGYQLQSYWGKVPVTFIGRLSQTRVVDLYRQIDVLMAPSTWPESYGLVTREAAACGCWVVASNMGGIGEDIVEGVSGFVIEPSLKALTTCLQKIDNKPDQFKAPAHPPELRRVAEQVKELSYIYSTQDTQ